jgi:hypothetical protein
MSGLYFCETWKQAMSCRSVAGRRAASPLVGVLPQPLDRRLYADGISPNLDGVVIPPRLCRQNLVCGNSAPREPRKTIKKMEWNRNRPLALYLLKKKKKKKETKNVITDMP